MPTLAFNVFDGGGLTGSGDASVNSDGVQGFNPHTVTGFVGKLVKTGPEFNLFFAFDISVIPRGSRFDGTNLEFRTSTAPVGTVGEFRIGYLLQDGIWNINGFANGFSPSPFYSLSYAFPNPISGRTAIPHATQTDSTMVEDEIMGLSIFATVDIPYGLGQTIVAAETRYALGDGIGGEDVVATLNGGLEATRNFAPLSPNGIVALTIDSSAIGAVLASLAMYLSDTATPSFRPTLIVAYTENPPVFTSVPVTAGQVDVPYTYDADADPWLLGDMSTGGETTTLTFELLPGFPTGMTINSSTGLVEWTPTAAQIGDNSVTIRVTNDIGGLTADQAFTIEVGLLGCPDGVARSRPAVGGEARVSQAVGGRAEVAVSVEGEARSRDAVGGRAVVRSAVGGFARQCPPKE